ncbi:MAG: MFS transporter [Anaerolineae bacterium]|nr:MFS transporter [Anaerolineae bacterium]
MRIPSLTAPVRERRPYLRMRRVLRALVGGPVGVSQTERNIWYLCVEVAWAGVLGAAISFNSAFAVRLGASGALVGALTSFPCLIAVLMLIPSARFLESRSDRRPWIVGSLFLTRLGYALLAILPWVLTHRRAEAAVLILIAATIPNTFFSAAWQPLLADVIPPPDRTRVLSMRMILYSAIVAGLTFLGGEWLEASNRFGWARFPLNYQVLYAVGFLGALVSTVYVARIQLPRTGPAPDATAESRKPFLSDLKTILTVDRSYRAIVLDTLVFDGGAWLVAPLYVIFFVRELGAGDAWIGLHSTLSNIGIIAGYALWRRALRRLGHRRGLLISAPLVACHAFLVSLFPNLGLILVWAVLVNLAVPGVNLSHFNILLQLCPAERRPTYIATFSTIINAIAFVMPMVGVALAEALGIRAVLFLGGSLRLLGAFLFRLNPITVDDVEIR